MLAPRLVAIPQRVVEEAAAPNSPSASASAAPWRNTWMSPVSSSASNVPASVSGALAAAATMAVATLMYLPAHTSSFTSNRQATTQQLATPWQRSKTRVA
jgi:hypothetical protein